MSLPVGLDPTARLARLDAPEPYARAFDPGVRRSESPCLLNAHEFDAGARRPERRALSIYGKGMEGSDGTSVQQGAPVAMHTVPGSG